MVFYNTYFELPIKYKPLQFVTFKNERYTGYYNGFEFVSTGPDIFMLESIAIDEFSDLDYYGVELFDISQVQAFAYESDMWKIDFYCDPNQLEIQF